MVFPALNPKFQALNELDVVDLVLKSAFPMSVSFSSAVLHLHFSDLLLHSSVSKGF